ncbi:MAG: DUF3791 domain-containing protein [Dysgonamonadaceae bacterium]|jgi:hypothetical protein|nr:DUF3791 domain-containing protein [Dysgonamonadaceae bacterium]
MNNEKAISRFIIFCLEHYKFLRQISGLQALAEFKKYGVIQYLTSGYEVLHTQGKNFLMADIQSFIDNHK